MVYKTLDYAISKIEFENILEKMIREGSLKVRDKKETTLQRRSDDNDIGDLKGIRTDLTYQGKMYSLRQMNRMTHEYGLGGHLAEYTFLMKNDFPVMIMERYLSWDTYSDDSDDFEKENKMSINVFQDDELVEQILSLANKN